jgi:adenine-specific DNA-methyltransferase
VSSARIYYQDDAVTLWHGDCREVLPTLDAASVDLVLTDPPYFRVKDEWWDRQWDTAEGFLEWLGSLCREWKRLLRPNGSLYCFASPRMAARVELEIGKWFNVLNRVTWRKPPFGTKAEMFDKDTMRTFFPASEAVIFAEQQNHTGEHLRAVRRAASLSSNDLAALFPSANGGATGCVRNWELGLNTPTPEQWQSLQTVLPLPPYEQAIRPFNADPSAPYTDVWDFPTVQDYPGKHPCEKPTAMLHHVLRVSSRPGAVVLDPTCGSGSTLVAAKEAGRKGIGIDVEERWCYRAARRLEQGVLAFGD